MGDGVGPRLSPGTTESRASETSVFAVRPGGAGRRPRLVWPGDDGARSASDLLAFSLAPDDLPPVCD